MHRLSIRMYKQYTHSSNTLYILVDSVTTVVEGT